MIIGISASHDVLIHETWRRLFPIKIDLQQPSNNCDVIFVVNVPHNNHLHLIKSWSEQGKPIIVAQCEPNMHTWGDWANPWLLEPVTVFEHTLNSGNIMEWWLPESIEELQTNTIPIKTRELSMVLSNKNFDPGHIVRINTMQQLQNDDSFACNLQLFGTINGGEQLPNLDKRRGLYPFKYHVAAENTKEVNYVTEKMWDSIIAGCCTFWWGGKQNMIDENVFVRLFDDAQTNKNLIKLCIEANIFDDYQHKVAVERKRLLQDMNMGTRIKRAMTMHV